MTDSLDDLLTPPARTTMSTARPIGGPGTRYALAALVDEAATVRAAANGTRNDTLNRAAFNVGTLVAGGQLAEQLARDTLTGAAHDAGLDDRETTATIDSGLRAGAEHPRPVEGAEPVQSRQSRQSAQTARSREPAGETDANRVDDLNADHDERDLRAWDAHELTDRPMQWLAPGWLPAAAVAVLVGDEGIGKSLWWVRVVAHLTTGLPDPTINLAAGPPRTVLLALTEDLWGEVKARLTTAGADLTRVRVLCDASDGSGNPVLPGPDTYVVAAAATRDDVSLIVVDAWLDTVAPGLRVADTQQARTALIPWANVAEHTGAAVLLLAHTNRLGTTSTRDKVGSTVALRQKARVLLYAATPDEQVGSSVCVGPDKVNNLGRVPAVSYRLDVVQARTATDHDPGTTARLVGPSSAVLTIGQLVKQWARDDAESARPARAVDRVRDAIVEHLRADDDTVTHEPDGRLVVPTSVLQGVVDAAGLNPKLVGDAVRLLGGLTKPSGYGGQWVAMVPHAAVVQSRQSVPYFTKSGQTGETGDSDEVTSW